MKLNYDTIDQWLAVNTPKSWGLDWLFMLQWIPRCE